MNTFDLIRQAGPLFWVLLALSFYVVYLAVTRFLAIHRVSDNITPLMDSIKLDMASNNSKGALSELDRSGSPHPAVEVLRAGLRREKNGPEGVNAAMNAALISQENQLYAGITTLSTVAQIAPLLGLLGTVIGMVRSFLVFSQSTTPTPSQLATGISEALINTAGGLVVAIVAYVVRNFLRDRAEGLLLTADQHKEEINTWLKGHYAPMAAPQAAPAHGSAAPANAATAGATAATTLRGRPLPDVALSFDSSGNVRTTQTLHDAKTHHDAQAASEKSGSER